MSVPGGDPQQLIKRIGRALIGAAPPNWRQVRAEYRAAGRHIEADVLVTTDDGQTQPVYPPMEVVEAFGELRGLMYQPGRGTWLSGTYLLDHPSKFSAEFEPDVEPRWRRVPPPIGFQDELRRFPREDAHIPGWLRARAGLPPITDPAQVQPGHPLPPGTPPHGTPMPPGVQPGIQPGTQPAAAAPPMPPGVPTPGIATPGMPPAPIGTPPGGTPLPPPGAGPTG